MFMRSLCAFLLLASSAAALDVFEDTIWREGDQPLDPAEVVNVFGNATLTIEGPGGDELEPIVFNRIRLYDSASFELNGGALKGDLHLLGEGNQIDFFAGRFAKSVKGNGSGTINLHRDVLFGGTLEFPGGEQTINVYGLSANANHQGARLVNSPGAFVNGYAMMPRYGGGGDQQEQLSGFPAGNTPTGWGSAPFTISNYPNWLMYAIDGRPDGDTNGDLVVDLQDLNNVRNHFGSFNYRGDTFPMDGVVDLNDLNTVRNQFGMSTVPVPEPSTLAISATLLMGLHQIRRTLRR